MDAKLEIQEACCPGCFVPTVPKTFAEISRSDEADAFVELAKECGGVELKFYEESELTFKICPALSKFTAEFGEVTISEAKH